MVDINADTHDVLQGDLAAPELPSKLAVDLEEDLLHHTVHLLVIGDSLGDHNLHTWFLIIKNHVA